MVNLQIQRGMIVPPWRGLGVHLASAAHSTCDYCISNIFLKTCFQSCLKWILLLWYWIWLLRVVPIRPVNDEAHRAGVCQPLLENIPPLWVLCFPVLEIYCAFSRIFTEWGNSFFITHNSFKSIVKSPNYTLAVDRQLMIGRLHFCASYRYQCDQPSHEIRDAATISAVSMWWCSRIEQNLWFQQLA